MTPPLINKGLWTNKIFSYKPITAPLSNFGGHENSLTIVCSSRKYYRTWRLVSNQKSHQGRQNQNTFPPLNTVKSELCHFTTENIIKRFSKHSYQPFHLLLVTQTDSSTSKRLLLVEPVLLCQATQTNNVLKTPQSHSVLASGTERERINTFHV